ncbi:MAG: DMT family transporter [Kiritimatiellae bacterium]|nr:DMT family transporter [Kiritimatiellia bacterium]
MRAHRILPQFAMLGAILCWASVPLFLRFFATTTQLDAWTVNGLRYGWAAVLLAPAVYASRGKRLPGRTIWKDALVPTAVNTLGQVGWALAPYFTDASVMAFGIRSCFFFTVLGGFWLLPAERYLLRSRRFWAGAVVCVVGIVALFSATLSRDGTSPTGVFIVLLTALVWGFYGVTVRRFMRGYSPHRGFGVICLYTAVILAALMFGFGRLAPLTTAGAGPIALILLSATIGIATAHVLMYYVLDHLGAVIESGAEFLTPFLTFCGAVVLFGEHLSAMQWAGGTGVVAGSLLIVLAYRPERKQTRKENGTR